MTASKTKSLRWSKFVWEDWLGDSALRGTSLAARGLWIDMLCIMHKAEPYGHLVASDVAITPQRLARMVGESPEVVVSLLAELEECGVFSRTKDGVIFSRRLLRDREELLEAQTYGKMGGNPRLKETAAAKKAQKTASSVEWVNPPENPHPTPPIKLDIKIEEREERVLATLVAEPPPAKADKGGQASLLPDVPPKPAKPKTDGQLLFSEGLEILASLINKKLPEQQGSVASLLAKMRKEAGEGQDAMLLGILRRAKDQPPASAVGWIKGAIANGKARLVVSNDPNDAWGIKAYCEASEGIRPVEPADVFIPKDAEITPTERAMLEINQGKWITKTSRKFFDKIAPKVAEAARLPRTWRGDWSPLEFWLSSGMKEHEIVGKIANRVEWLVREEKFEVGNLSRFTSMLMEGRAAA